MLLWENLPVHIKQRQTLKSKGLVQLKYCVSIHMVRSYMESELNHGMGVEVALGQKRSTFPETWKALNSWIWHHFF